MNKNNEMRNIILMNMKRIQKLENVINNLENEGEKNKILLELVKNLLETNRKNHDKEIFQLNYLQDIYSETTTNINDFVINKEIDNNEDPNEILIPPTLFS